MAWYLKVLPIQKRVLYIIQGKTKVIACSGVPKILQTETEET